VDRTCKKKWEVTRAAFDKFLVCLDPDPEKASREYLRIRERLTWFFDHRGCRHSDELADETFNRVIRKVSEGEELRKPASYCGGVAWNVLQEYWDSAIQFEIELDSVPANRQLVIDTAAEDRERGTLEHRERRHTCQWECVRLLRPDDRSMLISYVTSDKRGREELAREMNVTIGLLRLKVFRIRQRLLECIDRCLAQARDS
jgi:DNA-directed RNA polymerase specialized sigma24 family protein